MQNAITKHRLNSVNNIYTSVHVPNDAPQINCLRTTRWQVLSNVY